MAVAAIGTKGNLPKEEEPHLIESVLRNEVGRCHHVAQGLGHLHAVVVQEAVDHDPLGQFQPRAHQEGGPVNCVEAADVLADHMQIRRPELAEGRRINIRVTHPGEVVGQRIHPHVHHVLIVPRDRDTPVKRGPADREVLQSALDEADDLVEAVLRCAELRLCLVQRQQPVLVGRQAEEVALLCRPGHLGICFPGIADAIVLHQGVVLDVKRFIADGVPALVLGEVDVAFGFHLFPDRLGGCVVVCISGADEPVVRDPQRSMRAFVDLGVPVHQLLGSDAFLLRRLGDLHAVLVRASQEHHVIAIETLEAGHRVGGNVLVSVADVRHPIGVRDGRSEVVRRLV